MVGRFLHAAAFAAHANHLLQSKAPSTYSWLLICGSEAFWSAVDLLRDDYAKHWTARCEARLDEAHFKEHITGPVSP